MAKSGFWLKGARGKLAGACMQKGANGQTVMHEIVTPRNPRTDRQLLTRAILSTVSLAYSVGKAIFDHSFEGRAVPAGNMHRFQKLNADRLRMLLSTDLARTTTNLFKGVGPATSKPVPGLYVISEGSLMQSFFIKTAATSAQQPAKVGIPAVASETETLAEYMERLGLNVGEIYTFVVFGTMTSDVIFQVAGSTDKGAAQHMTPFGYVRLTVVEPLANKAQGLASAATLADFMQVDSLRNIVSDSLLALAPGASANITSAITFAGGDADVSSFGIIRSEENSGLRSSETMEYASYVHDEGLTSDYILAAWKQGSANVGNSELILEGGSF